MLVECQRVIVRVEKSWGYFHTSKRTAGLLQLCPSQRVEACRSCRQSCTCARLCGCGIDMSTAATELYEKAAIAAMLCRQPAQIVSEWSLESLRLQKIHSEGTVFHGRWPLWLACFVDWNASNLGSGRDLHERERKAGVSVRARERKRGRECETKADGKRESARARERESGNKTSRNALVIGFMLATI